MTTCLRWILGYTRLEIWRKIGLSGDWCLCTVLHTRSGACCCWTKLEDWRCITKRSSVCIRCLQADWNRNAFSKRVPKNHHRGHLPAVHTLTQTRGSGGEHLPAVRTQHKPGEMSTIIVFEGGAGVGGTNVRSHLVSQHTRVRRWDKQSSAAAKWWVHETALDSNLIGLHLLPTATNERDTRRGLGPLEWYGQWYTVD